MGRREANGEAKGPGSIKFMINSSAAKGQRHAVSSLALYVLLAAAMSACMSEQPYSQPATAPAPPMAGADRDIHGCIGSAGYAWCAQQDACVRPWELAREQGFEPGADAFTRYCSGAAK